MAVNQCADSRGMPHSELFRQPRVGRARRSLHFSRQLHLPSCRQRRLLRVLGYFAGLLHQAFQDPIPPFFSNFAIFLPIRRTQLSAPFLMILHHILLILLRRQRSSTCIFLEQFLFFQRVFLQHRFQILTIRSQSIPAHFKSEPPQKILANQSTRTLSLPEPIKTSQPIALQFLQRTQSSPNRIEMNVVEQSLPPLPRLHQEGLVTLFSASREVTVSGPLAERPGKRAGGALGESRPTVSGRLAQRPAIQRCPHQARGGSAGAGGDESPGTSKPASGTMNAHGSTHGIECQGREVRDAALAADRAGSVTLMHDGQRVSLGSFQTG